MKRFYEKPEVKDELTINDSNSAWACGQPYCTCFPCDHDPNQHDGWDNHGHKKKRRWFH